MSRMNWSRVRGEKLVRERGSERAFDPTDRSEIVHHTVERASTGRSRAHKHVFGNWHAPLKLVDERRYRVCSVCGLLEYEGPKAARPTKNFKSKPAKAKKTKTPNKPAKGAAAGSQPTAQASGLIRKENDVADNDGLTRLITSGQPRQGPRPAASVSTAAGGEHRINWLLHRIQFDRRKGRYFCTCPWPGTRTAHSEEEARAQHQQVWNQLSPKSRLKWQMRAQDATRASRRPS